MQDDDPLCKRAIDGIQNDDAYYTRRYCIGAEGLLFRKRNDRKRQQPGDKPTLVVPASLRPFVMHRFHSLPITGHKGGSKTTNLIAARYYWPGLYKDVRKWIR